MDIRGDQLAISIYVWLFYLIVWLNWRAQLSTSLFEISEKKISVKATRIWRIPVLEG